MYECITMPPMEGKEDASAGAGRGLQPDDARWIGLTKTG